MDFIKIPLLLGLSAVFISCGQYLPQLIQEPAATINTPTTIGPGTIEGDNNMFSFISNSNNSGEIYDKKLFNDGKVHIIFISSIGCEFCLDEHDQVKADIANGTIDSNRYSIYTFIAGHDPKNQTDLFFMNSFNGDLNVSWDVGGDPELKFFEICGQQITPCTIITDKDGKTLYSHVPEGALIDLPAVLQDLGL
jgi:hypothetical protein